MTEQTPAATPAPARRKRRSAEEKWQIYLDCMAPGAKIGDILRAHGMYASELQTIRRTVEAGAKEALRASNPGRRKVMTVAKEDHEKLRQEMADKEHAFAELMVMFTALKKSELGVKGRFPSARLPEETKGAVVKVVEESKLQGLARVHSCALLQVSVRRVERWRARVAATGVMGYAKPGPTHPWNALVPEERDAVRAFVAREETADLSLQAIAIKGGEQALFFVSASTVRTILAADGLLVDRRPPVRRRGTRVKPARPPVLDGPNQCWCWDISYILTNVRRCFWYLYVMLDEWSRKAVAWRISASLAAAEARLLIDDAVIAEGILQAPPLSRPIVVNDRGIQMKAKPVAQMFTDLGITQTFARPRTPNDNPFVESFFSTVKTAPSYPQFFPALDQKPVTDYFERFFPWYNGEHYHSRIGYVHPIDKHEGRADAILAARKRNLTFQHEHRKMFWTIDKLTGGGL